MQIAARQAADGTKLLWNWSRADSRTSLAMLIAADSKLSLGSEAHFMKPAAIFCPCTDPSTQTFYSDNAIAGLSLVLVFEEVTKLLVVNLAIIVFVSFLNQCSHSR